MVDACGVKGRRRTWLAAKSDGEVLATGEPSISEWGNPTGVMPGYSAMERQARELKHLSTWKRGNQPRFPK